MNDESKKILEMLETGKINAQEATTLLEAIREKDRIEEDIDGIEVPSNGKGKWLRVFVKENTATKPTVNIKLPLSVAKLALKLGGKLSQITPNNVREELKQKGISIDDLAELENISEIIDSLSENGKYKLVEVDDGGQQVEVTIE